MAGEFDLIQRIRARAGSRADVILGIGDDAAVLRVPPGQDLVVTQDTLNVGVHFPDDTAPADLGWKTLAVNLSDLAAMGAQPAWCTLSLSLPESDTAWLDAFLDGFLELAAEHGVALVGGDTTRGPLSLSLTAHGFVPASGALRRAGARVGDEVWVTGTLGDAAAALTRLSPSPAGRGVGVRVRPKRSAAASPNPHPDPLPGGEGEKQTAFLRHRLDRPTPRVAVGLALRNLANACIDVSDGLLADLGHVLAASAVGAEIEIARLPCSEALAAAFVDEARWRLQLAGGDDYELCFTAAAVRHDEIAAALARAQTTGAVIGRVVAGRDWRVIAPGGRDWTAPQAGYEHFRDEPR